MEPKSYIILLTVGLVAGMLGGMLGIGGAIIIIPALVMLLGYSQHLAQGTSLLMLALPVSSLAAWQYYQNGFVDVKAALILAVAFLIGGFFGGKLAGLIPEEILRKGFAILLLVLSLKMLLADKP